MANILHGQQA